MPDFLYSPSTGGFYTEAVHGAGIPGDAVPVTAAEHTALMAAQSAGARVVAGAGGVPEADTSPQAAPAIRRIAALAFRRRLGAGRRAAITLAASQAMAADPPDAALQVWLDDLASSVVVDLDDAETVAGVAALLAAGLINQAERDALMADGTAAEAA